MKIWLVEIPSGMMALSLTLRARNLRSDHASNYLALKGVLSRDTEKLLQQLRDARDGKVLLRPEWARGL